MIHNDHFRGYFFPNKFIHRSMLLLLTAFIFSSSAKPIDTTQTKSGKKFLSMHKVQKEKQRPTIDPGIPSPRRILRKGKFTSSSLQRLKRISSRYPRVFEINNLRNSVSMNMPIRESRISMPNNYHHDIQISRNDNFPKYPSISSNTYNMSMLSHDQNTYYRNQETSTSLPLTTTERPNYSVISSYGDMNLQKITYSDDGFIKGQNGEYLVNNQGDIYRYKVISNRNEIIPNLCTRSRSPNGFLVDQSGAMLIDRSGNPFPSGPQISPMISGINNTRINIPTHSPSFNPINNSNHFPMNHFNRPNINNFTTTTVNHFSRPNFNTFNSSPVNHFNTMPMHNFNSSPMNHMNTMPMNNTFSSFR